jgi:hypothetical protein
MLTGDICQYLSGSHEKEDMNPGEKSLKVLLPPFLSLGYSFLYVRSDCDEEGDLGKNITMETGLIYVNIGLLVSIKRVK